MKLIFIVAICIGWLVAEMREFISNGGFNNSLAFNLLRIILAMVILVCYTLVRIILKLVKSNSENQNFLPSETITETEIQEITVLNESPVKKSQHRNRSKTPERKFSLNKPYLTTSVNKKIL
jgi:hypothetical protein